MATTTCITIFSNLNRSPKTNFPTFFFKQIVFAKTNHSEEELKLNLVLIIKPDLNKNHKQKKIRAFDYHRHLKVLA